MQGFEEAKAVVQFDESRILRKPWEIRGKLLDLGPGDCLYLNLALLNRLWRGASKAVTNSYYSAID